MLCIALLTIFDILKGESMTMINKYKRNFLARRILMITGLLTILGLTACQQEGSAEKVGQKLDRSIENAEKRFEQMTEQTGKELYEAKKSISDHTEASGQYLSDSVITTNVKAAILNDPLLKVSQIKVVTVDGIVQLNGMLDSQESIDRATEVAGNQKDVKSVQNNLLLNAPVHSEEQ
jgi:hyperosmotically inducible protein